MLLKIKPKNTNQRLDKFVKEQFPDYSRSFLQKAIEAGQVLVNGKKVAVHCFLKNGDTIEADIEAPRKLKVEANPAVKILSKCPSQIPLNPPLSKGDAKGISTYVIHEEPDFIVINKPAGLVVHQAEGHKDHDTLVNGLLARWPEIAKVGDPADAGWRAGLVHRLDKDASGIMVVARTQAMFDHLKSQFKLRQTKKEYLALVFGQVSPAEGTIEFAISRQGHKMVARAKGQKGKTAETAYETIKADKKFSLLRVKTHTGRTHQIRVHLFAMGHPIVGDKLYKTKSPAHNPPHSQFCNSGVLEFPRLMLHAQKLGFYDLSGQWREFQCPPPQEFTDLPH